MTEAVTPPPLHRISFPGRLRLCYTPSAPHPKQAAFLASNAYEMFFGGSGGGGKSFCLLAAALQYADVPGYSALILRRKLTDLTMRNALIDMSHQWLDQYRNLGVVYNANERKWTFPSTGPGPGAVIQFGYLDGPQDLGRYRGIEVQTVCWDELGEFPDEDLYTFLFSRLRRPVGLGREAIVEKYGTAPDGTSLFDIPLRFRAASNPGGAGSSWVYRRFVDPETRTAPFMPSSYRENPAISDAEYEQALSNLSEIERRRMGDGDWTIAEVPGALWKMADIGRDDWTVTVTIESGLDVVRHWNQTDGLGRFDRVGMGIDPSVGEGAGDEAGIVVAGQEPTGRIVVLDDRSKAAHPDEWSRDAVIAYHEWQCSFMVIEEDQGGQLNRTQIHSAADALGMARPNVILRKASKVGPKEVRAAAARQGYTTSPPMVVHHPDLAGGKLEAQQVSWVPGAPKALTGVKSPDRIDALAWVVREMFYGAATTTASDMNAIKDRLRKWST